MVQGNEKSIREQILKLETERSEIKAKLTELNADLYEIVRGRKTFAGNGQSVGPNGLTNESVVTG
jgi:hypothetical protein